MTPPHADDGKHGVPHPITGAAGPPGTVDWIGETPIDAIGQDMNVYAREKAKLAEKAGKPVEPLHHVIPTTEG